jgi:poly-gamma-glutamate synthesis protein (capsule biosynthesis protein)
MSRTGETQSIAITGDSMVTQRLSVFDDPAYLRIREILQTADAVFTNLEAPVHSYLDDPHAQRDGGGTYVTMEPHLLDDLKWLGINLVACGSSHAEDYGQKGILDTLRHLDRARIPHAGLGRHMAEARSPAYLETARGRVALIAASSEFKPGYRAGEQRYDTAGHPGVNGLRHKTLYNIDAEMLAQLRKIGQAIGWEAAVERRRYQGDSKALAKPANNRYDFLGKSFAIGDELGERTFCNEADVEENLRQVRNARSFADKVMVSLHCHEMGGPSLLTAKHRSELDQLADFAIDFGRRAIDAGADIFVAHGPQVPLAVEIYKGKPMLHGVGTFIFQVETIKYLPSEAYERYGLDDRATPADFVQSRYAGDTRGHTADPSQWEQVFAVCDFAGDELRELRLYPIELGFRKPRSQRGRPAIVQGAPAERIIGRVRSLSSRYGTRVELRDGIGVVVPQ